MYANKAQNNVTAARTYEEALTVKHDRTLLHTLMGLYTELQAWEKVTGVLRAIAELEFDPRLRAKQIFAMAQTKNDLLHDAFGAAELFEEAISIDPTRLDAFERVVRIYTEQKDWERLEHAYRHMLGRAQPLDGIASDAGADDRRLHHALWHQLGLVYRDRLGDAERALDAFRQACLLRPDDAKDRKIVSELLVVTDRIDEAIQVTRTALKRRPLDHALYGELYDLFLRQRQFDKAWCAVNAMAVTGKLNEPALAFYHDYPATPLWEVPGSLTGNAWRSHLVHRDLDPELTTIFALIAPAVARVRFGVLPQARKAEVLGKPISHGEPLAPAAARAVELIRNASEILSLPMPEITLRPMTSAIVPAPTGGHAFVVSPESAAAIGTEAFAFILGKRLAELRPELMARSLFLTTTELGAALASAVRITQSPHQRQIDPNAPDAATLRFEQALAAALLPEQRSALSHAIHNAQRSGRKLDVKRWSQYADLTSTRAGLLLCGHVDLARRAMMHDTQSPCDLPPRDRLGAMLLWATSDEYAELRAALGIAIPES
jgi:tetratricopeptide (TPR) repeat protein